MSLAEFRLKYSKLFQRGIIIFYTVGFLLHILPRTRALMLLITPWFLALFGALVLLFTPFDRQKGRWLAWLLVTYLFTLAAEIVGVNTGILFGDYVYGPVLGVKIAGAPLLIGFNWVIVLLGMIQLAGRITKNKLLQVGLSGLFCFLFDFIMEPVAIHLNYWQWSGGIIPLKNYLTWTVIALLFSGLYHWLKPGKRPGLRWFM